MVQGSKFSLKPGSLLLALGALSLFTGIAWAESPSPAADTVIVNARIYTVNLRQPWAEALAIQGDKILAVGSAKEIAAYRATAVRVIDAGGRLILPGFTDCHVHFLDGSLSLERVDLAEAKTVAEIQQQVKAFSTAHPEQPWVLGRGWSYTAFAPSGLPDKRYLDEIVPNRPVYLEGFDGHTWWANSRALELAGITRETSNPPNGEFVRDPKTGEPTGAVKEDAADAVMRRSIPVPTREEKLRALRAGMKEANRFGLVRVHVAGSISAGIGDVQDVGLFDELRRTGELSVRMYLAYRLDPPAVTAEQLRQIDDFHNQYHDEWISAGAAKFFLDGVIETRTAAMLEPYTNDPSRSGELNWSPAVYQAAVTELDRRGIQIFSHAVGDRAIRQALDSYANAQQTNHTRDARHRIEHIECISAADIPRFGQLGVIASFQPLHAYPDDDIFKVWSPNVGPERTQRAWAWRSIKNGGGVLGFGSDWPIVTLSPWPGVQNALTRQTAEGEPPGGFLPQERLSLEDTIRAYTLDAAFAGRREKSEGSLEPGKLADLIVLSQDLFKIAPGKVASTEVLLTMVGGKVVYRASTWPATPAAAEVK
ncbi:MAG TPA: amidohydrolase [Terriglobales bacterium]|nr:amidohydrolase [Terriglobales bacterium]